MQRFTVLQFVRPTDAPVASPHALKYCVAGVACELAFQTDGDRTEKAAELVAIGTAVVFKPAQA